MSMPDTRDISLKTACQRSIEASQFFVEMGDSIILSRTFSDNRLPLRQLLASTPARLRWRHGTARTRLDVHITEPPTRPCSAWPGKAEPAATSFVLCPGTGRKKAGIFPASRHHFRIFAGASAMLRISSRASKTNLPQNIAVKPAAGRFTRYTQHITDQAHWPRYVPHTHWPGHYHRRIRSLTLIIEDRQYK